MINGSSVLAIIPARGGSKGLPGKNIREFCGKPLIAWPIEMASKSRYIDCVTLSTDSEEIAAVARRYGAEVIPRPPQLATDTAVVADVVRDLLSSLQSDGKHFDYAVLLEATSPMRTLEMVDECIELLAGPSIDSVATFSEADPPPTRLWRIEDGLASTFLPHADPWLPRQLQTHAYRLNGLLYGFSVAKFMQDSGNTLFVGRGAAKITDGACVDIDTQDDFEIAEFLIRKRHEES